MNDKKAEARKEMLKAFSKKKSGEAYEPTIGEKLKAKKMSKVTVMADDKEGLAKGLSKAQQILKAKLGEELFSKESEEDSSEESAEEELEEELEEEEEEAHDCETCPIPSCPACDAEVAKKKSE